jgi:hypothetical protein
MPTIPLTTVLQNRQVFLPDPVKQLRGDDIHCFRDTVLFLE